MGRETMRRIRLALRQLRDKVYLTGSNTILSLAGVSGRAALTSYRRVVEKVRMDSLTFDGPAFT